MNQYYYEEYIELNKLNIAPDNFQLKEDEHIDFYCHNCKCLIGWKHKCKFSYMLFWLEPNIKDTDKELFDEFKKHFTLIINKC